MKIYSTQNWNPIEDFYTDGIIKLKNESLVKIIKVLPINYELKSNFEKEAILNSYKAFLKNCNFDIQIIVQSKKEDISNNIKLINQQKKIENSLKNYFILDIFDSYINFIKRKNQENLSSSKIFYILINSQKSQEKNEKKMHEEIKDKYIKLKNSLSKCGNNIIEIKEKDELEDLIKDFLCNKEDYIK